MMKKVIVLCAVLLLSASMVMAADVGFRPISARIEAMGGAGIATARGNDSLFMNPATLAHGKFSLNLPVVSLTVFNPYAILDSRIPEYIEAGGDSMPMDIALEYMNKIVTAGRGEVVTTDVGFSFTGGGLGLGVNVQEQLHTTSTDGQLANDKFIAELNVAAPVGLGFRLNLVPDVLSIDVGATAKFVYKAYTEKIGAPQLITILNSDDPAYAFMSETALAAGWAVPIDIGANINLPIGLRLSAVARNINAKYTMQDYSELGGWLNEMTEMAGMEPIYTDQAPASTTTAAAEYVIPWTLDVGFGWMPYIGSALRPSLAVDLTDVLGVIENPDTVWNNLTAGAEIKLLSMLDIRGGINKGYYSVGVGLDLLVIHVDASYYWREFGVDIGDKPADALTIRVNLGVDG